MIRRAILAALAALTFSTPAFAQSNPSVGTANQTAPGAVTQIGMKDGGGKLQAASASNPIPVNCAVGCAGGSTSNASSGVATSSTNSATDAWLYGFNGTTWDQLQVDGSKFLKVNSTNLPAAVALNTGAAGASTLAAVLTNDYDSTVTARGTISDASSAVATAATNVPTVAYTYGFNGTTWDQLQVDGSKNLKSLLCEAGTCVQGIQPPNDGLGVASNQLNTNSYEYGFNGSTEDKVRNAIGAAANGNVGTGVMATEEDGKKYTNITTATTTPVKSGAGTFGTLCFNTYVASATVTIYDNTSATGTKIATITLPSSVTALGPICNQMNMGFNTGLTLVTSGATDITVGWR